MKINSVTTNYCNCPVKLKQNVNFNGSVCGTSEQIVARAKKLTADAFKDRSDIVSLAEKQVKFDDIVNTMTNAITTIKEQYSPLVYFSLIAPTVLLNKNSKEFKIEATEQYLFPRHTYHYCGINNYTKLPLDFNNIGDNNHRISTEIAFLDDLLTRGELDYNTYYLYNKSNLEPDQILHIWEGGESDIKFKINDDNILANTKRLKVANEWFQKHPEYLTSEIADKLQKALDLYCPKAQAIIENRNKNANNDMDNIRIDSSKLGGLFDLNV